MIKHIVIWKMKESAEGRNKSENCNLIKKRFEEMPAHIPEIKFLEVGINRPGIDKTNHDLVLICHFESVRNLETYQQHPFHTEIKKLVAPVRQLRVAIDYEI